MVKIEIKQGSVQAAIERAAAALKAKSEKDKLGEQVALNSLNPQAQAPTISQQSDAVKAALARLGLKSAPVALPSTLAPTVLPSILTTGQPQDPSIITVYDSHGRAKEIKLNDKQLAFCDLIISGKSCILIGAAGTGKTTTTKAGIQALVNTGIPIIDGDHKYLTNGLPGIVPCAYTRRATNNIKRAMSDDIAKNTITIHKLLEYSPVYRDVIDEESGKMRTSMRFEPLRCVSNPLAPSISVIIIDEASMVSVELFAEIQAAIGGQVIFVLIGDIQQLPPVFGHAILGYKLLEWPVVELTEVYRQALDSPIISLAHRILSGKPIPAEPPFKRAEGIGYGNHLAGKPGDCLQDWNYSGQLQIILWPKKLGAEIALYQACQQLKRAYDSGKYDPDEDVILCPFNKSFGTLEINKHIANHIARAKNFMTFEIIAGFQKYYYSIGDKVLFDKEDAIITNIEANNLYIGKSYQEPSYSLDYWGHDEQNYAKIMQNTDISLDSLIDSSAYDDSEERTVQASHKITMQILDSGQYITVQSLSDLTKLDHAYAMTVHKSQGSEFNRVFLLLHHSHASMLRRELLYTAVTRAAKQLVIICEPNTFMQGITRQTIKGNTLAEKAEFFKGKVKNKHN